MDILVEKLGFSRRCGTKAIMTEIDKYQIHIKDTITTFNNGHSIYSVDIVEGSTTHNMYMTIEAISDMLDLIRDKKYWFLDFYKKYGKFIKNVNLSNIKDNDDFMILAEIISAAHTAGVINEYTNYSVLFNDNKHRVIVHTPCNNKDLKIGIHDTIEILKTSTFDYYGDTDMCFYISRNTKSIYAMISDDIIRGTFISNKSKSTTRLNQIKPWELKGC